MINLYEPLCGSIEHINITLSALCKDVRSITSKIFFISLFLCAFLSDISKAQTENIKFDRISIEHGLSQSAVYRIEQDNKGFMWFATQEGLNRYDGNGFVIYRNDRNDPNSISSNNIWSLMMDKAGNLWIGTEGGGLNKFDSKSNKFTRFIHKPDDSNSISDNNVRRIYEDSQGYIWVGTDRGLNRYDQKNKQFSRYCYDPNNPTSLAHDQVYDVLEDSKGVLWIATYGGGICLYNDSTNSFTRFLNDPDEPTSLISNVVNCINEDNFGNLWIGTTEGLSRLNPANRSKMRFTNYKFNMRNKHSLSYNDVRHIYHDSQGELWIGTDGGGLNNFNYQNERFINYKYDAKNPHTLSEDRVQYIFEDRSGVLWIGTWSGGVNKVDRFKKKFYLYQHIPDSPGSLSDNGVYSLYYDSQGTLWAGTVNGLNKFNQSRGSFTTYKSNPRKSNTLTSSRVWAIHEHPSESGKYLWVGTNMGLNHFNKTTGFVKRYQHDPSDPTSLSNDRIFAIYADSHGSLWIGTDGGGLNLFDRTTGRFTSSRFDPNDPTSISDDNITTILESNNGNLWIGTRSSGLNLFDRETKQFIRYKNDPENPNTLINNNIWTLHRDKKGDLWVGTEGGLSRLTRNRNGEVQFTHYTDRNVLPNNRTYGILEDDKGNFWISTNGGLAKFNPKTMDYKKYDVSDGLQSNEFNMAYSENKDGLMAFGGINGLNIFHPDSIRDNPYIPPVVITDFQIFTKSLPIGEMADGRTILNQSITETKEIELDYLDDVFSFEFAALHYVAPENNQYSYIMEGFEEKWNVVGNRHFITYTNLDGGEYTFRIRGSNSDSVWNTVGTSIKVIINPPFWETTWFISFAVIFLITAGFTGYRLRIRSITAQRELLKLEVDKKTQQLKVHNEKLIDAKKETDDILHNVEEGLFLLNSEYMIESQHSESLKSILNEPEPKMKSLVKILEDKVSKKLVSSIEEFVELMFRDEIEEETINDLNPLSEIELNFDSSSGVWMATKHLSFKFKRIPDEAGKTVELITTVKDITEQIQLEQKLEESESQSKRQMEWLLSILHVEPNLLKDFIEGVKKEIADIDRILRSGERDGNFIEVLDNIHRSMHIIKGNASLLDLKFFANQAHEFEDKINEIKEKDEISGADFVPLSLQLGYMRRNLSEINSLIERISQIRTYFRPKRAYENQLLITSIDNLIQSLSQDMKKEVKLQHKDFKGEVIPYQYRLLVKDILVQLVRNSVRHGIESTEERKKQKKPVPGTIEISTFSSDHAFGFKFIDDGKGMQISKLRDKIKSLGKWSEDEIDMWEDKKIAESIFVAGVTTSDKVDLVSGRGVGMDLVKHKLETHKGKIHLEYKEGKYCKFTVTLPKVFKSSKSIGEEISS